MTTEKAREILKEEVADLTDEEVSFLIQSIGGLCDAILDVVLKNMLTLQRKGS